MNRHGKNNPNYGNYKLLSNEEELIKLYDRGMRCAELAQYFGCNYHTVYRYLKRLGTVMYKGHSTTTNPNWKGGKNKTKSGYILVHTPNHPSRVMGAYVLEHRLVMEKHLGRYLKRYEVVHHKDGDKTNNNIDNLELFSSNSEHFLGEHMLPRGKGGRFVSVEK